VVSDAGGGTGDLKWYAVSGPTRTAERDTTFITRLDAAGDGPRLAVKDLIDVEGVVTTAGCRAVADQGSPASSDAPLMSGARAAGARIVGKTNMHELACSSTGINPAFGTPINPLDAALIPGGSSSGSAVAVATEEADVAFGTDTAASIRIPAACCGIAGLKPTHGRISLEGVWPLAPSLDTVGPMARDVDGLLVGMQLLEPGFDARAEVPDTAGRLRLPKVDPALEQAIDSALAAAGLHAQDVSVRGWRDAWNAGGTILLAEMSEVDGHLLASRDRLGDDPIALLEMAATLDEASVAAARATGRRWRASFGELVRQVQVVALPTLPCFPPRLDEADPLQLTSLTMPVNLAGFPAVSIPIPAPGPVPASLQIVAGPGEEATLLAMASVVEAACR